MSVSRTGGLIGPVRFHCEYVGDQWYCKDVDFAARPSRENLIGRGSLGAVYHASFRGATVAAKAFDEFLHWEELPSDSDYPSTRAKRVHRLEELVVDVEPEITALANVPRHPSLCSCLGIGYAEIAGVTVPLWIVMELAEENFHTFLRGDGCGSLQPAEALRKWIQILTGLDILHALGVVHRNLKPSNILLRERNGRFMVADYGLARVNTSLDTFAGAREDSQSDIAYTAQDGATLGKKADMYAAVILLAEMLTGEIPPKSPELRLKWVERACKMLPGPAADTVTRAASLDARLRPVVAEALFSIFDSLTNMELGKLLVTQEQSEDSDNDDEADAPEEVSSPCSPTERLSITSRFAELQTVLGDVAATIGTRKSITTISPQKETADAVAQERAHHERRQSELIDRTTSLQVETAGAVAEARRERALREASTAAWKSELEVATQEAAVASAEAQQERTLREASAASSQEQTNTVACRSEKSDAEAVIASLRQEVAAASAEAQFLRAAKEADSRRMSSFQQEVADAAIERAVHNSSAAESTDFTQLEELAQRLRGEAAKASAELSQERSMREAHAALWQSELQGLTKSLQEEAAKASAEVHEEQALCKANAAAHQCDLVEMAASLARHVQLVEAAEQGLTSAPGCLAPTGLDAAAAQGSDGIVLEELAQVLREQLAIAENGEQNITEMESELARRFTAGTSVQAAAFQTTSPNGNSLHHEQLLRQESLVQELREENSEARTVAARAAVAHVADGYAELLHQEGLVEQLRKELSEARSASALAAPPHTANGSSEETLVEELRTELRQAGSEMQIAVAAASAADQSSSLVDEQRTEIARLVARVEELEGQRTRALSDGSAHSAPQTEPSQDLEDPEPSAERRRRVFSEGSGLETTKPSFARSGTAPTNALSTYSPGYFNGGAADTSKLMPKQPPMFRSSSPTSARAAVAGIREGLASSSEPSELSKVLQQRSNRAKTKETVYSSQKQPIISQADASGMRRTLKLTGSPLEDTDQQEVEDDGNAATSVSEDALDTSGAPC